MTAEQVYANEVSKYAARQTYGILRQMPEEIERLKLFNKEMILDVLTNVTCLEELTFDEAATFAYYISLQSI